MISSRAKAPRHGGALLVVDGAGGRVHRKATFALYPTRAQEEKLHRLLRTLAEVYNAGLAERREAWRLRRVTVTLFDQYGQIKDLKGGRDDALAFGIQPVRTTLKRLDEAYAAFFQRIKAGQRPGFPRFRSHRRHNTAYWDEPISWKVRETDGRPVLYVQGVGDVPLSKHAGKQLARLQRRGGVAGTLTVTRRCAGTGHVWRAAVGFKNVETDALPATGRMVGVDRGVTVTAATSDGALSTYPAEARALRHRADRLGETLAGKKRGSRAWRKTIRQICRTRRRAANLVDNWARETAADITATADVIVLEDLQLKNMTKSAKGTVDEPGRNVAAKSGLNREMQAAALGKLATRIRVKAEEAGRRCWLVDPRNTSRTCPTCGHCAKANRPSQAVFRCQCCGHTANADVNAAVNIAAAGAQAEAAWRAAGSPQVPGSTPRMRRRKQQPAAA